MKSHTKPTMPHRTPSDRPATSKEASPDSVIMEISEKQRNDPIVKEYALADPRTYANEPAPGSSPYSPPEDDGEDEPYDPEYGLDSPVGMATEGKTDVKATKMVALPGVIPPGGSTTVGVSSLVGQLVGSATTPTEITAAMLATLAGSSGLSEQRKVLIQLTEKVEEQKRAIQQQMQLTQQTNAPKKVAAQLLRRQSQRWHRQVVWSQ
ncbi:hypothetical protein NP493_1497g00022 [Ridgeia piscesae]|uniref:Uncharacterized protein n=1 Tax=Ridgeia piscesae TaxID=27915 RepID=A0AAD9K198_RIDPI|nr:hypothetical protein NP493_1497g00022 [Ridgeia piscesae]